jgi:hypothetical protein
MAYVNITIFENAQDVGWRVVDGDTQEQFYGYPSGNYDEASVFVNFLNLQTGSWEFEVFQSRDSDDIAVSSAEAVIGRLDVFTGETLELGRAALFSNGTATPSSSFTLE